CDGPPQADAARVAGGQSFARGQPDAVSVRASLGRGCAPDEEVNWFQNKFARCRTARPVLCRLLSHDPAIASASALAEIQPAFVVVVATAPQLDLVDGRLAPQSVRIDVVELDETALIAPRAIGSDKGEMSQFPQ